MSESAEQDLKIFRTAAVQREWTTLQDTLKRLLAELDPLIAIQVAAERLSEFVPVFERYYSEATWVRDLLLTVVSYGSAPNELPEYAVNQFASPGCGNFVRAVFDLARAAQPKYTVFERYSHITNSIANANLAGLQYLYFASRPQKFTALVDSNTAEEKRAYIQRTFWLDEETASYDVASWLEIAEDIEDKLKQKS